MWEYNHTSELSHHGVLGMKWGHRTNRKIGPVTSTTIRGVAKLHTAIGAVQQRSANSIKKDSDSLRTQKKAMLSAKSKNGKPLFTEKDVDNMINTLDKSYKKKSAKASSHSKFAKQLINELGQLKVRDLE